MELLQISEILKAAILEGLDEFKDGIAPLEFFNYEVEPELIAHKGCDGFIPFTNGGYELTLFSELSYLNSSGSYPKTAKAELEQVVSRSLQEALESFIEEYSEQLAPLFPALDLTDIEAVGEVIYYPALEEMGEYDLAEQLNEHEHSALCEGAIFAYQAKIIFYSADNHRNISGKDEVLFLCGVNTDFEYIRDKGLVVGCERNCTVEELEANPELVAEIFKAMIQAL